MNVDGAGGDHQFDGFDLAWGEPAGNQLAELGVHRRILHHHRWVILQANEFQLAIVDRQALGRGEGLVVAGCGEDVGVPREHVVVMSWIVLGDYVVDRIVVA